MKVHKIYVKKPSDPWSVSLTERVNIDIDPRDYVPTIIPATSSSLFIAYNIIMPYKAITYLNANFVGYDRKYIDDNTLDVFYEFTLPSGMDVNTFARSYLASLIDTTNPVVSNFLTYVNSRVATNLSVKYQLSYKGEDDQGNLFDIV